MYSVCVVGGGMVGSSIAYHLAKFGMKNVAIFEKSYISSGSTGRCGGGIRQQWSTKSNVRLAMRSVELFERMEEETGFDVEYRQGGYLLLSYSEEEAELFEKNVKMQREEGLDVEILTPKMVKDRYPFINTEGLVMATFCQTDGHANPHKANFAYILAAKRLSVNVHTHTEVLGIDVQSGTVEGVQTNKGYFKCGIVVNAAGEYSREVGQMAGIDIPTTSYRHQIMVTEPFENFFPFMAISFSGNFYMRQTLHGQMIMGQGDPDEKPGINRNVTFAFTKDLIKKLTKIFPFLKNARVMRQWSGSYNMSPDAQPIIGESSKVKGYFYAVGFSGHGFMLAPAVGEALAEWIIFGKPKHVDVTHLKLERFEEGIKEVERNVV